MPALSVGAPYPGNIPRGSEGVTYQFDASGHTVHAVFDGPNSAEVSAVRGGEAEAGFVVVGPAIVLLLRCGSQPWWDAPYSWHLVQPARQTLPTADLTSEERAPLTIVMVDSRLSPAIVKALRIITFAPETTRELHQAIRDQANAPWDERAVDRAVAQLPPTPQLVRMAKVAKCAR